MEMHGITNNNETAPRTSLQALSEIAETINTIQEPERLLEEVLEIAMERLQAERGFILLESRDTPEGFEVKTSRNFNEEQLGEMVRFSTSVVHKVQRSGEPELIYETKKDERYRETESIVIQEIQSIACVPLSLKDRQIGVIYLDSQKKRSHFTRDSLPFLTAFAHQAAIALENARLYRNLREDNRRLRSEIKRIHGFEEIVGQSPRMQEVFDTVARVCDSNATILIEGESGTGKELVARAVHYNGPRKDEPFIAIFCGSLPDELLESELFGHAKGSFTGATTDKKGLFEEADGGAVFLDEVGDLSPTLQRALLRVLQEGEIKRVGETKVRNVDVRVLSATNRSLEDLIEAGEFREDLFYRLNTISIALPPLRYRRGDIPLLANHFLDTFAKEKKNHLKGFTQDAMQALRSFPWPGNVRELENTIERAVVLSQGDLITEEDLRLPEIDGKEPFQPGLTLKEVERRAVQRTLEDLDGNISETARVLDVSRRWIHYRLKEWDETSDE